MSLFSNIQNWGNSHRLGALDYFRVVVGLYITFKGIMFLINLDDLRSMTANMDLVFASAGLAHYVVFAHVLGGPLLTAGLYTRIMAIIQMPILIGALFFVNAQEGFMSVGSYSQLSIAAIVLLSLIVFTVFGSGKLSIDHLRRKDQVIHPNQY